MSESTEYFGQRIAVSSLPGNITAAYTFTNTKDRLDTQITAVKVEVKDKQGAVASWGKTNKYPQEIIKSVKTNGAASSAIRFLRKAHYGNGLVLIKDEVNEAGKKTPKVVPVWDEPTINEFFMKSQMNRFWKETIADLEWFSIAFPEYILSENFKTINRVKRQKTAWCRFEMMNEENGLVEHVYISEKFGKETPDLTGAYVEKVPLIDSYWSPEQVKIYCQTNGIKKFIRPVFYPLLDEAFYPEAEWHAVAKSGWLDVANSVPELKKSLFQNQMTLKYIIEIDERYFEKIYRENWFTMKPEETKKIRQDVIDNINSSLVGNDKAGKSIQGMKITGDDGKPYPAVTITAIDDKLKDGSYLPDASAANSETLFAIGVNPAIIGAGTPGGSNLGGSGSNIREAYTVLSATLVPKRIYVSDDWQFLKSFNGWEKSLIGQFSSVNLTTLDKNPSGQENIIHK